MNAPLAIISGGTKGLGRELSLAFARAGHRVIALYHADETAARALAEQFRQESLLGQMIRLDVSADASSETLKQLPGLHDAPSLALVHNACARFEPRPLHLLGWEDFESSLSVALKGAWLCSQALIRPMLKSRRGTIVTVLTAALHGPAPKGFAAYLSAKHALRGYTEAMASEYSVRGVRVFSVSPGFMETSLTANWDRRLRGAIGQASKTNTPAEVAARILELVKNTSVPGAGEDHLV